MQKWKKSVVDKNSIILHWHSLSWFYAVQEHNVQTDEGKRKLSEAKTGAKSWLNMTATFSGNTWLFVRDVNLLQNLKEVV